MHGKSTGAVTHNDLVRHSWDIGHLNIDFCFVPIYLTTADSWVVDVVTLLGL